MAYVVTRSGGRFEIRESLHTSDGPRARSLAGFDVLTDEVLAKAARRAQRPFDLEAVLASGRRAGALAKVGPERKASAEGRVVSAGGKVGAEGRVVSAEGKVGAEPKAGPSATRFVEASRRMARTLQRPPSRRSADPGAALIELLGFTDAVTRSQPPRPFAPLEFPALSRLAGDRSGAARLA